MLLQHAARDLEDLLGLVELAEEVPDGYEAHEYDLVRQQALARGRTTLLKIKRRPQ